MAATKSRRRSKSKCRPRPSFSAMQSTQAGCLPTGEAGYDPMNDFPPEANCSEPWKVDVVDHPIDEGLTPNGGATMLIINVYDWQGLSSYETPTVECPELFNGTLHRRLVQSFAEYSVWAYYAANFKLAPVGDYKCLVKVVDKDNAGSPDWVDLTAYQIHTLTVKNIGRRLGPHMGRDGHRLYKSHGRGQRWKRMRFDRIHWCRKTLTRDRQ